MPDERSATTVAIADREIGSAIGLATEEPFGGPTPDDRAATNSLTTWFG